MGRLTRKDNQGNWHLKGVPWERLRAGTELDKKTADRINGALCKLMAYEDTGLEPAEVVDAENLYETLCDQLLKKLAEEREKHRWIPVGERLPEKRGRYLVTAESAGYRFLLLGHYNGPDWTEERSDQRFIAWMPLPEPYRQAKRSDGHTNT